MTLFKKMLVVLCAVTVSFAFVADSYAASGRASARIEEKFVRGSKGIAKLLTLENGATTDTLTGVAAAAASLDTIDLPGLFGADKAWLYVNTTQIANQDSVVIKLSVSPDDSVWSTFVAVDTIVTASSDHITDLLSSGRVSQIDISAFPYCRAQLDGVFGADADSTAYEAFIVVEYEHED